MIAILRREFSMFSRMVGSWIVTSWSTMNRLMPRIETESSSIDRRHLSSQVWKHTREQMAGNGFFSRWSRKASAYRFSETRET